MTSLVTVYRSAVAGEQADIDADSIVHVITKQVTPIHDSDGTNRWQEDNRYVESWAITGTVTLADTEDLIAAAKIVTDATYPKLRVYDKSANPFYTDYSPVRIQSLETVRLNDDEYRVTIKCAR